MIPTSTKPNRNAQKLRYVLCEIGCWIPKYKAKLSLQEVGLI